MIRRLRLFAAIIFTVAVWGYSDNTLDYTPSGSDIAFQKNIDLSRYQLTDTTVNLQDVKWYKGKIYVALHYLNKYYEPAANSRILEMDESGNVLREFRSNFSNVYQIILRKNDLFVIDRGSWYYPDVSPGGITKIDLASGAQTTVFDGAAEGRSPIKMEFVSEYEGYMIMGGSWGSEKIAKFSLNGDAITLDYGEIKTTPISSISYNNASNILWFTSGSKIYKYSLENKSIEYNVTTALPTVEIISAGETTLSVESNYTAGKYGVIISDRYYSKSVIDGDAGAGFADGNFYILERSGSGKLIFLDDGGEIIRQLPFDSKFFNPFGVCGNAKGDIYVGSKEDLTLAVFALEGFEAPTDPEEPDTSQTPIRAVKKSDSKHGILLAKNIVSDKAEFEIILPDNDKILEVKTVIYDNIGNVVYKTNGKNTETFVWNLNNTAGRAVANGTYLIVAQAKGMSGKLYVYSTKIGVKR